VGEPENQFGPFGGTGTSLSLAGNRNAISRMSSRKGIHIHMLSGAEGKVNEIILPLLHTYLAFRGPCIVIHSYNESQRDTLFFKFIW